MAKPIDELVSDDIFKNTFYTLFELMRRYAFTKLGYSFDGSGDDGTLEPDVQEYEGLHDAIEPKAIAIDPPLSIKEPNGKALVTNPTDPNDFDWVTQYVDVSVSDLEELGYRCASIVLDNNSHDWYNNDGGFGTIVFSITPEGNNAILCNMNLRITTSEAYPDTAEFPHGAKVDVAAVYPAKTEFSYG